MHSSHTIDPRDPGRPTPGHRRNLVAAAVAASVAGQALGQIPLPDPLEKADGWRTGLSTDAGPTVWDDDFASWWTALNADLHDEDDGIGGDWTLEVRYTFTQCYSGGFVEEIRTALNPAAGIEYGANSSAKFHQSCSANAANTVSQYAFAWQSRADGGVAKTDERITEEAYDGLVNGKFGIPANLNVHNEQPQYRRKGGPKGLTQGADRTFVILFTGDPEPRHERNMTDIWAVLTGAAPARYAIPAADIHVLWGAGAAPGGVAWPVHGAGRKANLQGALAAGGWLDTKIRTAAGDGAFEDGTRIKVLFWSSDHGAVSAPISFSVDPNTTGVAGTDVNALLPNSHEWIFEGNLATNIRKHHPVDAGGAFDDVNAMSFGKDAVLDEPGVYFSVDSSAAGVAGSGVAREVAKGNGTGGQVFTKAARGNREMIPAKELGLDDRDFPMSVDNLNALSMNPISLHLDHNGDLTHPLFYSFEGSAKIWILDPWHPAGPLVYLFLDLAAAATPWDPAIIRPMDIDAMSLRVDVSMFKRDEDTGDVYFKPGIDKLLFSVPSGDTFPGGPGSGIGCEVWSYATRRVGPGIAADVIEVYDCDDLGLSELPHLHDELDAMHAFDGKGPFDYFNDENEDLPPLPTTSWNDTFDDYEPGRPGPDGLWEPWDRDPAGADFQVTPVHARSAPFSLEIDGIDDAVQRFNGYSEGRWTLTTWIYVPSTTTDAQMIALLNEYAVLGEKGFSLRLAVDGLFMSIVDLESGAFLPIVPDTWRELRVEIDLDADTQDVFYDDQLLVSTSWTNGAGGAGRLDIAAIALRSGGGGAMYFDDMSLVARASCVGDFDGDGVIGFGDLLAVLGAWGCAGCPEDLDGDGTVGFGDLLVLLGAWGGCA